MSCPASFPNLLSYTLCCYSELPHIFFFYFLYHLTFRFLSFVRFYFILPGDLVQWQRSERWKFRWYGFGGKERKWWWDGINDRSWEHGCRQGARGNDSHVAQWLQRRVPSTVNSQPTDCLGTENGYTAASFI